jgi:thiol-disulfide isomerase/thioredoxin
MIRHVVSRGTTCMRKVLLILAVLSLVAISGYADEQKPRKAPNFSSDAEWIDSGAASQRVPHSIKGYRGKVLLIDFWEFTCINCIRDFGVLKRWYAKYHSFGLEIVGVHFGEFPIGFNADNVREAARRFQLPWPVVADLQGTIWRAYHSDSWPNRYLIDPNTDIVLQIAGEGNNQRMEEAIRQLLAPIHPEVNQIPLDPPEDTFASSCGISTQETYVGDWFGRGAIANPKGYQNEGESTTFHQDGEPADGKVMLSGRWITRQDGVTSDEKNAATELRYHARSIYAVLSLANSRNSMRVDLLQDGKPLTQSEAGVDVRFDSQGSYFDVNGPRMYYLVKNAAFSAHLLELKPRTPDFVLHSFTYGNNCQQDFDQR